MLRRISVLCAAASLWAGAALATPLGDAQAGLAALDRGDSAEAVRLLTKALTKLRGRLTEPL